MGRVEQERVRQLLEQRPVVLPVEQGQAPLVVGPVRQGKAPVPVRPVELLRQGRDLAVARQVVSGPPEDSAVESLGRSLPWKGPI